MREPSSLNAWLERQKPLKTTYMSYCLEIPASYSLLFFLTLELDESSTGDPRMWGQIKKKMWVFLFLSWPPSYWAFYKIRSMISHMLLWECPHGAYKKLWTTLEKILTIFTWKGWAACNCCHLTFKPIKMAISYGLSRVKFIINWACCVAGTGWFWGFWNV